MFRCDGFDVGLPLLWLLPSHIHALCGLGGDVLDTKVVFFADLQLRMRPLDRQRFAHEYEPTDIGGVWLVHTTQIICSDSSGVETQLCTRGNGIL